MNERIRLLSEQATVNRGRMRVVDIEKFAELIVRECASVQHKRFCEHGDVSWDILMEHFGVEE